MKENFASYNCASKITSKSIYSLSMCLFIVHLRCVTATFCDAMFHEICEMLIGQKICFFFLTEVKNLYYGQRNV